jgi:hypothetical protein
MQESKKAFRLTVIKSNKKTGYVSEWQLFCKALAGRGTVQLCKCVAIHSSTGFKFLRVGKVPIESRKLSCQATVSKRQDLFCRQAGTVMGINSLPIVSLYKPF